ncbi:N-acetylglucosamine repressor [Oceanobacillus oncorhynchi]|uniref:N-acetylglucosamine repressor n=1 Tax=Oceanobacillus oncorhynchi TaxID=545501 RepID=A0A0A1ML33_9BACI|nr:ROK family transcriptional regulator [Oceanobacillus oncorhynchi]CEI80402.1 N-acetylglucosamine repressor [Oceanobacillus oncorhynchi]
MIKGHIETIKKMNRELIIKTVRDSQPISRSAIAKSLSLSKSTVSSIVNDLVDQNILQELGHANSTKEGGRRAVQLGFNANYGYIVGLGFKKNVINGCLTDLNGDILLSKKLEVEEPFNDTIIINFIYSLIEENDLDSGQLLAIGCSVPGMVDSLNGIVSEAPELNWNNINLKDLILKHFNCEVFINNNVNCLAMLEKWNEHNQNLKNFVYLYVGYGIGTAIIANNHLITGANFKAGEIGFFKYPNDVLTSPNEYGEFGELDHKASLLAFPEDLRYSIQHQSYNQLSSSQQEILIAIINNLGFAIGNIISLLNPEKLILGGELSHLVYSKRNELLQIIKQVTPIDFQLEFSKVTNDSASLGSLTIALDKLHELIK